MIDPGLTFPVIAIGPDGGDIETFHNEQAWLNDSGEGIGFGPGALLIDSSGHSWRVEGRPLTPAELGPVRSFLIRLFRITPPVELSYVPGAALDWQAVIDLVLAAIENNREDWVDEEAAAGEAGEPVDEDLQISVLKGQVRKARNLDDVVRLLYWTDHVDRPKLVAGWTS